MYNWAKQFELIRQGMAFLRETAAAKGRGEYDMVVRMRMVRATCYQLNDTAHLDVCQAFAVNCAGYEARAAARALQLQSCGGSGRHHIRDGIPRCLAAQPVRRAAIRLEALPPESGVQGPADGRHVARLGLRRLPTIHVDARRRLPGEGLPRERDHALHRALPGRADRLATRGPRHQPPAAWVEKRHSQPTPSAHRWTPSGGDESVAVQPATRHLRTGARWDRVSRCRGAVVLAPEEESAGH